MRRLISKKKQTKSNLPLTRPVLNLRDEPTKLQIWLKSQAVGVAERVHRIGNRDLSKMRNEIFDYFLEVTKATVRLSFDFQRSKNGHT